jgi:NAD dependent epimerase/dehydratase family
VGIANIFEAAIRNRLQKIVYASSAAIRGLTNEYPAGPLAHEPPLKPRARYGVYKQANEGTATPMPWRWKLLERKSCLAWGDESEPIRECLMSSIQH